MICFVARRADLLVSVTRNRISRNWLNLYRYASVCVCVCALLHNTAFEVMGTRLRNLWKREIGFCARVGSSMEQWFVNFETNCLLLFDCLGIGSMCVEAERDEKERV